MFGQVGFSTVWVEILRSAALGISTYFRDFHLLGRDSRMTATGFSTFPADFRTLGRDLQPAAAGFSTVSADFRILGRDFRMAEVWWLSFAATSSPAHPFVQKIV